MSAGWLALAATTLAASESPRSTGWQLDAITGETVEIAGPASEMRSEIRADGSLHLFRGRASASIRLTSLTRDDSRFPIMSGNGVSSRAAHRGTAAYDVARTEVQEWFEQSEEGLRQWIRVPRRPGNAASLAPFSADLEVSGLTPVRMSGDRVVLADEDRAVFRYQGIRAWDATGKDLPARLQTQGQTIRLVVDDQAASYPVTIDPAWSMTNYFAASTPESFAQYGGALATVGGTTIIGEPDRNVGARTDAGRAYFVVGGSVVATFNSPTPASAGSFGQAVDLDGNWAAITELGEGTGVGRVHLYQYDTGTSAWVYRSSLNNPGTTRNRFGYSVAIEGSLMLVGAPFQAVDAVTYAGRVYAYRRIGSTWSLESVSQATVPTEGAYFGSQVELEPETSPGVQPAAISAQGSEVAGYMGAGAVHIGTMTTGNPFSVVATLTPPDPSTVTDFGTSVGLSGTHLLVGSHRATEGLLANVGKVWAYEWDGSAWALSQTILSPAQQSGASMGQSLDLQGSWAIVGAQGTSYASTKDGVAYIYKLASGTWTLARTLPVFNGEANSTFASTVALADGIAVVGVPYGTTGAVRGGYVQTYAYTPFEAVFEPTMRTGGKPISLRITTDTVAPAGGTQVQLTDVLGGIPVLPASLTIPEGSNTVSYTLTPPVVATDRPILVNAVIPGVGNAYVDGLVRSPRVGRIDLARTFVASQETVNGTVVLNGAAPAGGLTITFRFDPVIPLLPTLQIPEGQTRGNFSFVTPDVSVPTTMTVYAEPYISPKSATLTISPLPRPALDIPDTVLSLGRVRSATVNFSRPAPFEFPMAVAYAGPVSGPTQVVVPSGATSVTFDYSTSTTATGTGVVTVTTDAGGLTSSDRVTVTKAGLVSALLSPKTVNNGGTSTLTLTLDRPAPTGGVVVLLSATKPFASFPAVVVVPAGSTTTTVPVVGNSTTARTIGIVARTYMGGNRGDYLTIVP